MAPTSGVLGDRAEIGAVLFGERLDCITGATSNDLTNRIVVNRRRRVSFKLSHRAIFIHIDQRVAGVWHGCHLRWVRNRAGACGEWIPSPASPTKPERYPHKARTRHHM